MEGRVFAGELAFGGESLEALAHHFAEELFSFDERYLHVAVGVTVEHELTCNVCREAAEGCCVLLAEVRADEFLEFVSIKAGGSFLVFGKDVVELGDEALDGGDELDEAFGNEHCAEVVAIVGAGGHYVGDGVDNVVEGHVLCLNFFRNDADVGLGLEGTFEGDVAGRAAHEFDEVPVFLGRVAVALDVADDFRVNLGGGVETE